MYANKKTDPILQNSENAKIERSNSKKIFAGAKNSNSTNTKNNRLKVQDPSKDFKFLQHQRNDSLNIYKTSYNTYYSTDVDKTELEKQKRKKSLKKQYLNKKQDSTIDNEKYETNTYKKHFQNQIAKMTLNNVLTHSVIKKNEIKYDRSISKSHVMDGHGGIITTKKHYVKMINFNII